MKEKVFVIYKIGVFNSGRKLAGIVYTQEQAIKFCENLAKRLDAMIGIEYEEYEMDEYRPEIKSII